MLWSLGEETEGELQMLLSHRKNGLDSLFKEVRVFKVRDRLSDRSSWFHLDSSPANPYRLN